MSDQGSPLIPQSKAPAGGQQSTFTETPEGAALRIKEADDNDWDFWQRYVSHATEFAKAAIRPEMTDVEKQAVFRASLDTITAWHRSA